MDSLKQGKMGENRRKWLKNICVVPQAYMGVCLCAGSVYTALYGNVSLPNFLSVKVRLNDRLDTMVSQLAYSRGDTRTSGL